MKKTFPLQMECLESRTFERREFATDYNGSIWIELVTGYKSY